MSLSLAAVGLTAKQHTSTLVFQHTRMQRLLLLMFPCCLHHTATLQLMGPNAAQLTAAVAALINALVASKFSTSGVMGAMNQISYARWGLEGYVNAEANCLTGECCCRGIRWAY